MENFAYGVLASILAATIIYIFRIVMKRQFLPYRQKNVFQGSNVTGNWQVKYLQGDQKNGDIAGQIKIRQEGFKIFAQMLLSSNTSGQSVSRKYSYKGKFHSGQLVMVFEDENAKGNFMGAMALKISTDLNELKGKSIYYKPEMNNVVAIDVLFKKID